jgi:hypothetical protein
MKEKQAASAAVGFMPAFIRLPKPKERDPVCGLSRSQLRKVVQELGVRTISLKVSRSKRVAKKLKGGDPVRGSRLIDVADLIAKIRAKGAQ